MSAPRTQALALILCTVAGGALLAPPRTTHYKIVTNSEQVVDLAAMGQGEQRNQFAMVNYLTITTDDSAGGRTVHAVLDSIVKVDSNPNTQQSMLDSARGRTWHAFMGPDGRLSNIVRVDSGQGGSEMISNFFPRLKPGAKVGDSWVDTTETASDAEAQQVNTQTITTYKVAGRESRGGSQALRLDADFTLTQTGSINQSGQEMTVDGTGSGHGTYYMTENGHYLGGESSMSSDLMITMDQLPAPIPVRTTSKSSISILP